MAKVLIAFSGGPDSSFLAHEVAFGYYGRRYSNEYLLFHFNHKMDEASDYRAQCAEKNAKDYFNLPFVCVDATQNIKNEEDARNQRYAAMTAYALQHGYEEIWTGHHKQDQIETILMRMARGSSLLGLSGMSSESEYNGVCIVRPLLTTDKASILEFLNDNNVPFILDETNNDLRITRNLFRKVLIPDIGLTENQVESLLSVSRICRNLVHSVSKLVDFRYENGVGSIDYQKFIKLDDSLRKLALSFLWKQTVGSVLTSKKVLKEIRKQEDRGTVLKVSMPNGRVLEQIKQRLILR